MDTGGHDGPPIVVACVHLNDVLLSWRRRAGKTETAAMLAVSTGTLLAAAEPAMPAAAGTVPAPAAKAADWAAANLVDKGMMAAARTPTHSAPAAYSATRPAPVQRRLAAPHSTHRFRRQSRSASQRGKTRSQWHNSLKCCSGCFELRWMRYWKLRTAS